MLAFLLQRARLGSDGTVAAFAQRLGRLVSWQPAGAGSGTILPCICSSTAPAMCCSSMQPSSHPYTSTATTAAAAATVAQDSSSNASSHTTPAVASTSDKDTVAGSSGAPQPSTRPVSQLFTAQGAEADPSNFSSYEELVVARWDQLKSRVEHPQLEEISSRLLLKLLHDMGANSGNIAKNPTSHDVSDAATSQYPAVFPKRKQFKHVIAWLMERRWIRWRREPKAPRGAPFRVSLTPFGVKEAKRILRGELQHSRLLLRAFNIDMPAPTSQPRGKGQQAAGPLQLPAKDQQPQLPA